MSLRIACEDEIKQQNTHTTATKQNLLRLFSGERKENGTNVSSGKISSGVIALHSVTCD